MTNAHPPSLLDALLPIGVLVVLLSLSVYLYGDSSSSGPNQIALMSAALVAGLVGLKNGLKWAEIEDGILAGIHMAMKANLILLAVGALIGTWILAGTVPTMIWLSPRENRSRTAAASPLRAVSRSSRYARYSIRW